MPTAGKLTVCILEAKNLKKMDVGGLSGVCSAPGCHWVAPASQASQERGGSRERILLDPGVPEFKLPFP